MLTLEQWIDIIKQLFETFGVDYGVGENEVGLPEDDDELGNAWFICPECGEPIYWCDWAEDTQLKNYICPICEKDWRH